MMVMWSQHTGTNDASGHGVTSYMEDEVVWKPKAGGGRERLRRVPPPEVLRGDSALMRQAIGAVGFKLKYSSAVLSFEQDDIDVTAFNRGDPLLRGRVDEVIQSFEDTAYAGIPMESRPATFWTTHTNTGRLELNFVAPRAIIAGDGRVRSINPRPPGHEALSLYDAWRDTWNARHGWADPEDPARAQLVKIPNWVSKLAAEAGRTGTEQPKHFARTAEQWVEAAISRGEVSCRDDLIAQLKAGGVSVPRVGKDYITLQNAEGARFRLRGRAFSEGFTSLVALAPRADALPRLDQAEAEQRLARYAARRAEFHRKEYGGPAWPSPEIESGADLPPMLPLEIAAMQTYRRRKPLAVTEAHDEPLERRPQVGWIEADEEDQERRRHYKQRLWMLLFGQGLPADLLIVVRYIDQDSRAVTLADGAVVTDHGDRVSTSSLSRDAVRLMVAEAQQKGWQKLKVTGSDVFKALVAAELVRTGAAFALNPEMQQLVETERRKNHVDKPDSDGARTPQVNRSPSGRGHGARAAADAADRMLERAGDGLVQDTRRLAVAERELAYMKFQVDLRAVAEALGFAEDTKAGDRRHTVMRHADGTKLIIGISKSGDWVFSSNDAKQGTVIDLLRWREGLSLGQCRQRLRPWLRGGQEGVYVGRPKPLPAPPDDTRAFAEWDAATLTYRSTYLEQNRGIASEVLASARFAGTFRVDDRHNAVFPYYKDGDLVGVERRNRPPAGTEKSFRAYSEGGRPGLWTSMASPDDLRLVIVESPIDAMSYHQLHPADYAITRYAAIRAGCSEDDIRQVIAQMPAGTEVVAACDADTQGEVYNEMVRRLTPGDRGFEINLPRAGAKDWNQMLVGSINGSRHGEPGAIARRNAPLKLDG